MYFCTYVLLICIINTYAQIVLYLQKDNLTNLAKTLHTLCEV